MWELDKESWAPKNWCFWTVVLRKTLESPLDFKENKPVNPKGNQLWIFTGRTDTNTEAPILWPPDVKSQLTGRDPDAGKDWGQEDEGASEDEMVRQYHWLNGHQSEQTPRDSEGFGVLQSMGSPRVGHDLAKQQQPNRFKFAVHLKRIQHCNSTILQWQFFKWIILQKKNNPLNKWDWDNWIVTCKRMKLDLCLTPYTKIKSNGSLLNVRAKMIRILVRSIDVTSDW